MGRGAWDEDSVREASSVRVQARQSGATVHFARILDIYHERGSYFKEDDPQHNMQDRSVLLGDGVIDQELSSAALAELRSSPPSMEAARALDAVGSYKLLAQDRAFNQGLLRQCFP